MSTVALVVIDVQRDFLDPTLGEVGSWEKAFCVKGIERILPVARSRDWRTIHVGTVHDGSRTLPAHQQRRGLVAYCQRGSVGSDFVVAPSDKDIVLHKSWYSAFEADLDPHLTGIQTVIWTGVAADCCIYQSAFDGDRKGLRNIVPLQAVSASKRLAFSSSLVGLAKSAADVVDLEDLLSSAVLPTTGLEPHVVEDIASKWFSQQQARLKTSSSWDLSTVLKALS